MAGSLSSLSLTHDFSWHSSTHSLSGYYLSDLSHKIQSRPHSIWLFKNYLKLYTAGVTYESISEQIWEISREMRDTWCLRRTANRPVCPKCGEREAEWKDIDWSSNIGPNYLTPPGLWIFWGLWILFSVWYIWRAEAMEVTSSGVWMEEILRKATSQGDLIVHS